MYVVKSNVCRGMWFLYPDESSLSVCNVGKSYFIFRLYWISFYIHVDFVLTNVGLYKNLLKRVEEFMVYFRDAR